MGISTHTHAVSVVCLECGVFGSGQRIVIQGKAYAYEIAVCNAHVGELFRCLGGTIDMFREVEGKESCGGASA